VTFTAGCANVVVSIVLIFYAADGFTFFFPGGKLCLASDESISEENISSIGVIRMNTACETC
jgi:hypothetical protein